jgi:hypothetical protein
MDEVDNSSYDPNASPQGYDAWGDPISGPTVTSSSPAGQAAQKTAGTGNTNGSGGQSVSSFLTTLGGLANQGTGLFNSLTGKKPATAAAKPPGTTNYLPYIIGGVALLFVVMFMGRR